MIGTKGLPLPNFQKYLTMWGVTSSNMPPSEPLRSVHNETTEYEKDIAFPDDPFVGPAFYSGTAYNWLH